MRAEQLRNLSTFPRLKAAVPFLNGINERGKGRGLTCRMPLGNEFKSVRLANTGKQW
jgi:hypothetical protein